MKLSLLHLIYQTPVFSWVGRHISPPTLFQLCRGIVAVSIRFNPHTRRYLEPLRRVLTPHLSDERVNHIAKMHLVQRRYLDNLPFTRNHAAEDQSGFFIEGDEHVREALAHRQGAILLSSHNFGVNRLIPSILSRMKYRLVSVGSWNTEEVARRWGGEAARPWQRLYLNADPWSRIRVTKQIAKALRENALVSMSVWNRAEGATSEEVGFFGERFYIDGAMMRLGTELRAPVLPCFAVCSESGEIKLAFHPPLGGDADEMSRAYCKLLSRYLTQYPEFCRFWKYLAQKKARW